MTRWPNPPPEGSPERDRLEHEAAAVVRHGVEMVGGTIRPEDQRHEPGRADVAVIMGKAELVALAEQVTDVNTSARYDAVNKMMQQPWMLTFPDGTKGTLPSSGTHHLAKQRHDDALAKQLASANKVSADGEQTRGRPVKKSATA
jgi:hypothetical protein